MGWANNWDDRDGSTTRCNALDDHRCPVLLEVPRRPAGISSRCPGHVARHVVPGHWTSQPCRWSSLRQGNHLAGRGVVFGRPCVTMFDCDWYVQHGPGSRHCHLAIEYCTIRQRVFDCKYLSCKICFNVLNYVFILFIFNLYCLVKIQQCHNSSHCDWRHHI